MDTGIQKVSKRPESYPIVKGKLRRAIITGFPHPLLFRLTDSEIVITTCVHFRRHPRHWR